MVTGELHLESPDDGQASESLGGDELNYGAWIRSRRGKDSADANPPSESLDAVASGALRFIHVWGPAPQVRCMLRLLPPAMLALIAGCSSHATVRPDNEISFLPFVPVDKKTTRADITGKWGAPHAEFDGGRIWTYRFTFKSPRDLLSLTPRTEVANDRVSATTAWKHSCYSLVLVFDGEVLKRHSLVMIR